MSVTNDLVGGLAQWTADAGIGVYRADGSDFLSTETGIAIKNLLPAPDRMIVLTAYGANNDYPSFPLGNQPVQVRFRGTSDPRDVDDLGDAVFGLWHGATNLIFGTAQVIQILRVSSIPGGMDQQSRRWERTDNYYIDVEGPASSNRPG